MLPVSYVSRHTVRTADGSRYFYTRCPVSCTARQRSCAGHRPAVARGLAALRSYDVPRFTPGQDPATARNPEIANTLYRSNLRSPFAIRESSTLGYRDSCKKWLPVVPDRVTALPPAVGDVSQIEVPDESNQRVPDETRDD